MPNYITRSSPEFAQQRPQWLLEYLAAAGASSSDLALFVLGDDPSWSHPAALVFTMPAGYQLFRHAHVCFRLEVVVDGSLIQEDGVTLRPGDVMIAQPGEAYGPHVAGPDGCTTVEIFSTLDGVYRVVTDGAGGRRETDTRTGAVPDGYEVIPASAQAHVAFKPP